MATSSSEQVRGWHWNPAMWSGHKATSAPTPPWLCAQCRLSHVCATSHDLHLSICLHWYECSLWLYMHRNGTSPVSVTSRQFLKFRPRHVSEFCTCSGSFLTVFITTGEESFGSGNIEGYIPFLHSTVWHGDSIRMREIIHKWRGKTGIQEPGPPWILVLFLEPGGSSCVCTIQDKAVTWHHFEQVFEGRLNERGTVIFFPLWIRLFLL